jgi:hypothetical protein
MSLRVCSNGHLTGQRHCGLCGANPIASLADRQTPVFQTRDQMKDLRQTRSRLRGTGIVGAPGRFASESPLAGFLTGGGF